MPKSFNLDIALDKLNNVTFKIINATKNVSETTSLIQNGSTITFTATSHTVKFGPYTYVNQSGLTEFKRYLEYGDFSINTLTLTDPLLWKFAAFSFTVNSCNYTEVKIPIYENVFNITFNVLETLDNVYIDFTVLTNAQMTFLRTQNGQTYLYTGSFTVMSFTINDMLYGDYSFTHSIADTTKYAYVDPQPLTFFVDSNKTITIRVKKLMARFEFFESTSGLATDTSSIVSMRVLGGTIDITFTPTTPVLFTLMQIPQGTYTISANFINNSVFLLQTTSIVHQNGITNTIVYKEDYVIITFSMLSSPSNNPLTTDMFTPTSITFKNSTLNLDKVITFGSGLNSFQAKLYPGTYVASQQVYTLGSDYEYISGFDFSVVSNQNQNLSIVVKSTLIDGSSTFTLSDMWNLQNSNVICPSGYGLIKFTMSGNFTVSWKCRLLPSYSSVTTFYTGWNEKQLNTGFHFLDRHDPDCGTNAVLSGWDVEPSSDPNLFRIAYQCSGASVSCSGPLTASWGMSGYAMSNLSGMGVDISSTNKFLGKLRIGATWQTSTKWIYYTECSPIR